MSEYNFMREGACILHLIGDTRLLAEQDQHCFHWARRAFVMRKDKTDNFCLSTASLLALSSGMGIRGFVVGEASAAVTLLRRHSDAPAVALRNELYRSLSVK